MHSVNQITPFTCGLACIESVATDLGISITQCDMLIKYKQELLADVPDYGDFGSTSPPLIQTIWRNLGLNGAWTRDHDIPHVRNTVFANINPKQAVLIFSNLEKRAWHCTRFIQLNGAHCVDLMVPVFHQPAAATLTFSFQDLADWDFHYAVISR